VNLYLLEHREFLDWATASLIEHERITDLKAWLRFYEPAEWRKLFGDE
jgi:hypothetical protein